MSTDIGPAFIAHETEIPIWGGKIVIVLTADAREYYPLPTLCRTLGPNAQGQLRRLQRSRVFRKHLAQFKLPTRGGAQMIWCIERRAVGLWLGTLDESTLRDEIADNVVRFQEELLDAADALLRGGEQMPILAVDGSEPVALQTRRIERLESFSRMLARRVGHIEGQIGELLDEDGEE
jgi:hypothetical protein